MSVREPIAVIGAGYVGLVTAAGFAELGSDVWCVDVDAAKIDELRAGRVPIYEPGLAELIAEHSQRMHFSLDLSEALQHARLLFIAVGTPPTASGDADLSAVRAAIAELMAAQGRRAGETDSGRLEESAHAIVMKSTVPCGTGAAIKRELAAAGVDSIAYLSCPEFLKEGSALADFRNPDRVVIGEDGSWAGDALSELYRPLLSSEHGGQGSAPLLLTDISSAEMIKLAANAFLATKISFINEIANVCEETGADVLQVARGMGLDERIGSRFLHAGIGYGGSCFTKDVSALKLLAGNSGYHFQLLASVIEVNELQKRRVISKLQRSLGSLAGRRIALLGLAFKPATDDMRGAASVVLAARLRSEGAEVFAYDPVATEQARPLMPEVSFAGSAEQALEGADAAVLVTEWPQLVGLEWATVRKLMRGNLIVDGRNALDGALMRSLGFIYEGVGRGRPAGSLADPAEAEVAGAISAAGTHSGVGVG